MRGHRPGHAGERTKRGEISGVELSARRGHARQRVVAVHGGAAMARDVLDHRQHAALEHSLARGRAQSGDLGWIARKMDNIQRRLDLQRGGKHTQKMQKEVLVRLDEMIKEIENRQKSGGS